MGRRWLILSKFWSGVEAFGKTIYSRWLLVSRWLRWDGVLAFKLLI